MAALALRELPEDVPGPSDEYRQALFGGAATRDVLGAMRSVRLDLYQQQLQRVAEMRRLIEESPEMELLSTEQLEALVDTMREREQHEARSLSLFRDFHRTLERFLAETMKGRDASKPGVEVLRRSLRESGADTRADIERSRVLCIAYRDLRWHLIGLMAQRVERSGNQTFSTFDGYLATRRNS